MTPVDASAFTADLCRRAPVIPVLTIKDAAQARPLAEALLAGGLSVLEVTLRTDCAVDAIRAISGVTGAIVGAGTLRTPEDVAAATAAGARFGVSPGTTGRLLGACQDAKLPLLPGAATTSEVMALLEQGYTVQKFFPAGAAGGPAFLRAIHGPIPQVRFCPTGGVDADNAATYLAMPNTLCVGGSWVAPDALVAAQDWGAITRLARTAAELTRVQA